MNMEETHTDHPLFEHISDIAEAGKVINEIHASEGASGNISIMVGESIDPQPLFTEEISIDLPAKYVELTGKFILVTGSNCRLRRITMNPLDRIALIKILDGGDKATMYVNNSHSFSKPTSELISHLMLHQKAVHNGEGDINAVLHAHPRFLKMLSHIPAYQNNETLNQNLMRWHPEMIVFMPKGITFVPYQLPGSKNLMEETRKRVGKSKVIVWERHGLITVSRESLIKALDLFEYVESAAHSEYMDILAGNLAKKLSDKEIANITSKFNLSTNLLKP